MLRELNILSSVIGAVDALVVFSTDTDVVIPWEWLRPAPRIGEADLPMLCESCRVYRWPADFVTGALSVLGRKEAPVIGKVCTIGLSCDIEKPWRIPTPGTLAELRDLCQKYNTIHIVGHFMEEDPTGASDELIIGKGDRMLTLTPMKLQAHQLAKPNQAVIISACGIGALRGERNMAVKIAAHSQCKTWTPLVSILDTDAEWLDDELVEYQRRSADSSVDEFFAEQRKVSAFASVYACYGL